MQTDATAGASRPNAQALSRALTIAWDLLVAADDPTVTAERAEETRRRMARQLVRTAEASHSMTDLWMAALSAATCNDNVRRARG